MDFKTLGNKVENGRLFKGSEKNPFLAPRGIFVANNQLFVADTGRNRVFIWDSIPTSEFQEPSVILGQLEMADSGRNAGGIVSAASLHYPSGIWSDGKKLLVADAWNHRVLIWHTMPTKNGQPADVVLGQPSFETNLPNVAGIGTDPDAKSLNWPYGLFSDGDSLWIADTGNRRILYYESIPTQSYAPADRVIGKETFESRDYNNAQAIWPYSVKISKSGAMAVADTQFYRVLLWHSKNKAFTEPADVLIGQANFDACGQNQFRLSPAANTLNWTYDACFYKEGLLVNDTGNSRVLWYNSLPNAHNQEADGVIGREDFITSSEFKGNMHGTQQAIYWPFSILTHKDDLFIADTGNHRVVICSLKPA